MLKETFYIRLYENVMAPRHSRILNTKSGKLETFISSIISPDLEVVKRSWLCILY